MATSLPPYGVAIQDAIASGDTDRMRQVADDAENYLREFGEIGDGLKRLRAAIGAGGPSGAPAQPLYAVGIRAAIQSGDVDKMKALATQAEGALADADEVRKALDELRAAIGG
jgi:hypothetical protein